VIYIYIHYIKYNEYINIYIYYIVFNIYIYLYVYMYMIDIMYDFSDKYIYIYTNMNVPTTALLPKSGGMFFSDRKLPEKLGCASLALDSPEFWKCIPPPKNERNVP